MYLLSQFQIGSGWFSYLTVTSTILEKICGNNSDLDDIKFSSKSTSIQLMNAFTLPEEEMDARNGDVSNYKVRPLNVVLSFGKIRHWGVWNL